MRHNVTVTDMRVIKLMVYHPCVCIYILRIPTLHFSIIMHMPRIASTIKILFQICWEHYLLCGDTADVDFEHDNSLLGEAGGADENWSKGTGVLSIILIYN
jgi:hypothetical protein